MPARRPPRAAPAPGTRRRAGRRCRRRRRRGQRARACPTRPCPAPGVARRRGRRRRPPARATPPASRTCTRAVRRAGVLEHVGQRLLHDPVRREIDPGGQPAQVAVGPSSTGRPADRTWSTSSSSPRRLGCGATTVVRGWSAGRAAGASRPALPARVSMAASAARAASGLGVDGPLPGLRLDDDDAHAVRDEVVQLAGDAGPLVGDGPRGLLGQVPLGRRPGPPVPRSPGAAADPAAQPPDAGQDEPGRNTSSTGSPATSLRDVDGEHARPP